MSNYIVGLQTTRDSSQFNAQSSGIASLEYLKLSPTLSCDYDSLISVDRGLAIHSTDVKLHILSFRNGMGTEPMAFPKNSLLFATNASTAGSAQPDLKLRHSDHPVDIRIKPDAAAYLNQNEAIHSLVKEAMAKLWHYFPGAPQSVSLLQNDDTSERPEIVLAVITQMQLSRALELLDKFDSDWWIDAMNRANGQMTVTIRRK